jgi:ribonuclease J
MTLNLKEYKENLLFLPLGGAGEIGMNFNLYHYKGKWIIIDCGAGFADDHLPGIDMMVADLTFIRQHKADIVGLVLTHAHEDHVGGVQYLWNELECQIYATTFTANFLKNRLMEYHFHKSIKIHAVEPGGKINLEPFSIEMVHLTHSAPEMQAIMIRTAVGNVLHTGDWKFDPDPVVGHLSDEALLKKYGEEGVTALVCDSTNVFNPGVSGSEGDLRKSLIDIIAGCPKMVVVTTFASNIARIDTLVHAAEKAGRRVVLSGRSLHRIYDAAQQSGYLLDVKPFVDERDIGKYKKEEILVIATGCQGEPLAAVSKMATNNHHSIKLATGDTVIFSSKIIPGNDKRIYRLFNIFVKSKIEVITERDHFVHVSGHPSVDELKRMYELVKPKVAIPVHGELVHIHEHAKLARKWGVKNAIEVENGLVIKIDEHKPEVLGKVHSGYLGIDGNYLLPIDSPVIKMRRRLQESGIIVVTVVFNKNGMLAAKPIISAPGCLDREDDSQILIILRDLLMEEINNSTKPGKRQRIKGDSIENIVRGVARRFIKTEIGKTPVIDVNVEYLSKTE